MSLKSGTQCEKYMVSSGCNKQFQYMYHSYQPYTRNTGLSNCILHMGNLTACAHVHVAYGMFWKITSTRALNLKFILLVGTFWHIGEMSRFCLVCEELGAKPTSFHKEQTRMVPKGIETVGFWTSTGGKGQ